MPTLNAVLETALYVDDLAHAKDFYESRMGLSLLRADNRMCAF
ncbi:MAG: glyoxalase, partial [Microvirga sp.]|nr:glyoxalase [Microvirga sp.]